MITDPQRIHSLLDQYILANVEEPGQYVNGEFNTLHKDHDSVDVRFALCFPDRYPLGMSHLGYKIFYDILNNLGGVLAERVYAPWPDMQEKMLDYEIPLYALESYRPVRDFDVLAFTLQSELLYTNILMMLDMAGVPLRSSERSEEAPLIIAGGPGATNPEPLADFVDLFFVGDGEETIVKFAHILQRGRHDGASREDLMLQSVQDIDGVYAPHFYEPEYTEDGAFVSLRRRRDDIPECIQAATVKDMDSAPYPVSPVIPSVQAVHEQISLEIMRGCTRGCRFCHAGMTCRPVRYRSPDTLMKLARESYLKTGFNEIGLSSLSSSDYPCMRELLERLTAHFYDLVVLISLPSLRVSDQLEYLVGPLSNVRKSSLTLAPEAATERLRSVINKDITEDELMEGARVAVEAGWKLMKLYFMVGLPSETMKDIEAVEVLCDRVLEESAPAGQRSPLKLNVTISPFVPKPHTPFQWEPMLPPAKMQERIDTIRDMNHSRKVRYKFHDPQRSFVEAVLARGDRRMGRVIQNVWKRGGQFDGWDDCFRFDVWKKALDEAGIWPDNTRQPEASNSPLRRRKLDEPLPWDHIDCGVQKAFLIRERNRAFDELRTEDCRDGKCGRCGVCGGT